MHSSRLVVKLAPLTHYKKKQACAPPHLEAAVVHDPPQTYVLTITLAT